MKKHEILKRYLNVYDLSNKIMRNKKINKYNDFFQDDSKIAPKELHFEFIFLLEYYSHAF